MTVLELKELTPKANVYELKPGVKYLVKVSADISQPKMEKYLKLLAQTCKEVNLDVILCSGDITFYNLES